MSNDNFSLYQHIDQLEIREMVELIELTCKMLDYDIFIERSSLSQFTMYTRTPNKQHRIEIEFHVNFQKKYLTKINLLHRFEYDNKYWYQNNEFITSGSIVPDFKLPLQKVIDILRES